jgi:EPS-associated MarR family transcriptional regulator|tara:strand:+ start:419 stop:811 length:393 start_codon:yes stop_codon:yes gene_type:complete
VSFEIKEQTYSIIFFTVQLMNGISVQYMNNRSDNQDHFNVMRKIQKQPKTSQRNLAEQLGFSLGKLNYCLKALQQKGLIKINNFQKNTNKLNYIYVLTPKGINKKTKLTVNFMKRKMKEYEELKGELKEK